LGFFSLFIIVRPPHGTPPQANLRREEMTEPQTREQTPPAAELIRFESVSKIFYTDEVETQAVSGVNLAIRSATASGSGASAQTRTSWAAR
jgi:hypothetical protein